MNREDLGAESPVFLEQLRNPERDNVEMRES